MLRFRTNTNQCFAQVENKGEIKSFLKTFEKGVANGSWEKIKAKNPNAIAYRAVDDVKIISSGRFGFGEISLMFFKGFYAVYKPK